MSKTTWQYPVVVVYGEDEYSIAKWIQDVISEQLSGEERQFGLSIFPMREQTLMEAIEEADLVSWLGNKKVVWIREAMFLTASTSRAEQSVNAAEVERLSSYLKSPNPGTFLIIEVPSEKLDERKKIVKQIKEQKLLLEFKPKDEAAVRMFTEHEARKRDLPIEVAALRLLQERCGSNLRQIESELLKCELYLDGRKKLMDVSEMNELVAMPLEDDIFKLTDAVIRLKWEKALEMINDLIRLKVEPIPMTLIIISQMRVLIMSLELASQGFSSNQIAGKIGANPFQIQKLLQAANKSKLKLYQRMLAEFLSLDAIMKRTGAVHRTILEDAILRIAVGG